MMTYAQMTPRQRQAEYEAVLAAYEKCKAQGLKLNMARGKPGKAQLDLVSDILTVLNSPDQ